MKRISAKILVFLLVLFVAFCFGCAAQNSSAKPSDDGETNEEKTYEGDEIMNTFYVKFNGHSLEADFSDNASAKAFYDLLLQGDVTVEAHDYGNFEKVGDLPRSLVRSDERITTSAGDVILYLGSEITVYYDVNTWTFTRLGKIKNVTSASLKSMLGPDNVTLTFSLEE